MTHGYRTRRLAVDYSIPLVTDVKCAKMLIEAMCKIGHQALPPMKTAIDCITSRNLYQLPGFIDVHTHVREPGATHKEDFASCTAAALAGGVTMICAMPNTNPSIVDRDSFNLALECARKGARCDYAIYVGASSDNFNSINQLSTQAAALKMYLNETFSTLRLHDMTIWQKHLQNWPKRVPLCVHAERQSMGSIILMAHLLDRPIHVCHVARKEEILLIRAAKEKGIRITCEVCPHHLFLSTNDIPNIGTGRAEVRPILCSMEDQQALWENMDIIDIFATDHAPHTWEEKNSANPPPGFPGLETILPLLLNAVNDGRLTIIDIINKFSRNPRRIFNLPDQPNTYVEVDLEEEWTIPDKMRYSKAQWTPFAGMKVKGCVHRVVLRNEVVYIDGEILAQPGFGENVRMWEWNYQKPIMHDWHSSNEKLDQSDRSVDGEPEARLAERLSVEPVSKVHFNEFASHSRPLSPMPRGRLDSYSQQKDSHLGSPLALISPSRNLTGKQILSVDMFNKEHLNDIFNLASKYKSRVQKGKALEEVLHGKVMASVFYEVSTRTCCSFAAAMQRLGKGYSS